MDAVVDKQKPLKLTFSRYQKFVVGILAFLDLRDPQYKPGSMAFGVPRPIIFILDRHGVIKAKLYEDTFKKRPPATLVVETRDKLQN